MKTILVLSLLILTAVSVNSQTKEWSANRRANGNNSSASRTVKQSDNKAREKYNDNNQASVRVTQSTNMNRNSNIRVSGNSNRSLPSSGKNEDRRNGNTVLADNNNRPGSLSEVSTRRERNYVTSNERVPRTDMNSKNHSDRKPDRVTISNRNYVPTSRYEHSDAMHYENNNFTSHHTRIEHWNNRGHERFSHFVPLSERRMRFPFIIPRFAGLIWSLELRNEYFLMYPEFRIRDYNYGYRLPSISAYDASEYIGEIATVYGVFGKLSIPRKMMNTTFILVRNSHTRISV
jgi:hypothetical protein